MLFRCHDDDDDEEEEDNGDCGVDSSYVIAIFIVIIGIQYHPSYNL
jgi:hypothetical protein